MSKTMVLTPAYGRDYRRAGLAKIDLLDNKDFLAHPFDGPSAYTTANELRRLGYTHAQIRYNRELRVTIIPL